ncbi:MAG: sulfatase-like hydrolase/transferase [Bacteroidales bacterium]|nr:sulfatase-like hydrolase/transferase [Bacteroidales bacterium]
MKPSHKLVLSRYLLSLCILIITQIIFYLLNTSLFNVNSFSEFMKIFVGMIRFALSTLTIFIGPYVILSLIPITFKQNKYYRYFIYFLYVVGIEFIMVSNLVDTGYFRFTFKRLTFDIFRYLGVGGDFNSLIPQFLRDYWLIVLIFISLNFVFFFIDRRLFKKYSLEEMNYSKKWIGKESIIFILTLFVLVVFQRGGFQYKPINLLQASTYASTQNTALVLNTPFTIYRTINKSHLEKKDYFSENELNTIYSPICNPSTNVWSDTLFQEQPKVGKTNVVLIIVESYAAEYLSTYNKTGKTYTPFLDSLAKQSIVFQGYSNGKRSIDGIPAVVSSLPLMNEESYITSSYSENKLSSIASTLSEQGYKTAFFHGGYNGTMNFNVFAQHVGYQKYYGKNEYNNDKDYDGNWGIFDEPYLQYMGRNLTATKQPFFATVFTLSSHHPYTIPPQHKNQFPKGTLIVHETVGYTDFALKRFFAYASKQSWYKNTIFIITADHSALTGQKEFQTESGLFRIPIIFYCPMLKHGIVSNQFMQQIDIFPTICDMLHLNKPIFAFGKSIFSTFPHYYIYFSNGEYLLRVGQYVSKYREGYPTELFDVTKDADYENNIANKYPNITSYHTQLTKAIIQQYNNRLIMNQTTIK